MESSQSRCEEIRGSSTGTTFLYLDPYAFKEVCLATAAKKSVVAKRQALAYWKKHKFVTH